MIHIPSTPIPLSPQAAIVSRKATVRVRDLTKAELKKVRMHAIRRLREANAYTPQRERMAREVLERDVEYFVSDPIGIAENMGTMEFLLATARLEGAMLFAKQLEADKAQQPDCFRFGAQTKPAALKVGQHLFTRDGRVRGNAIIIAVHDTKRGIRYDFETDFGNVGRSLTIAEIHEGYYTTDKGGEVHISELQRWRGDRDQLRTGDQ